MKLQTFGIEIRKIRDTTDLYADVDLVLANNSIPKGGVSKEVQSQAIAHAIQEMIKPDKFFSICTISECVAICGICISGERLAVYHACHCIHWRDMLPDFRQSIIAMLLDDFREILNPKQAQVIKI